MKKNHVPILVTLLIILSCQRPDQSGPNDSWCTSGISVLTVDDSNVPASIKTQIYSAPPGYTHTGDGNYNPNLPLVIIPYEFPGSYPFNTAVTTELIRNDFFSVATGSVRDYFYENSWGQYTIREGFIANVSTLRDTVYYHNTLGPDWGSFPDIPREICERSNVNWRAIDVNGDHVITMHEAQFCFLGAFGPGGSTRPFDISIKTSSGDYIIHNRFSYIGVKRNDDPTKGTNDLRSSLTIACHELCHGMFNLPDRYQRFDGSGRTGQFDIMSDDDDWKHISMYDKMKIGWIRPRILIKPSQRSDHSRHCYNFPNSTRTPAALILWDQSQPNEYWIVENRDKLSALHNFDGGLPEGGLAIWWADENTDSLSIVDARNLSIRPQNIMYSSNDFQLGVLFRNRSGITDSTFNMQYLRSGHGFTEFAIRAPSPPGTTMYAEF